MDAIEERAKAMCAAPLGCAFLSEAIDSNLAPSRITSPLTTFKLLSRAVNDVSVWQHNHAEIIANLLARGEALFSLAEAMLREPNASWWFGPLDRSAQVTAERWGNGWRVGNPVPPTRTPNRWERYARKPGWSQPTSTLRDGTTSFLYNMAVGTGDLFELPSSVQSDQLSISTGARVYDVDSPGAWHRLCMTYPAQYEPADESNSIIFGEGLIVPDYAAVARDWDGVHITIGALLTADQVRTEGEDGWTMLWGFDAEMCMWLHPVWEEVTPVAFDESTIRSWIASHH